MLPSTRVANRLVELSQLGQSVWLDNIRRDLLTTGALRRMVEEDGLGGVTSNPAIFKKPIVGSNEYSDILAELQQNKDLDAKAIYERIAIRDIQDAADVLRVVYDR